MDSVKIKSILENNKYFPHLYDPYYDRKDIKKNLYSILNQEKMDLANIKKQDENSIKLMSNQVKNLINLGSKQECLSSNVNHTHKMKRVNSVSVKSGLGLLQKKKGMSQ